MKVLAGVKRVIDYQVRVQVKRDGTGVVTDGVKMSINPFDEIALEEALRLRERGLATEVVAVSIGPADAQQQLRTALAMGADRALLVETNDEVQPLLAARIFAAIQAREQAGIILLGKQAIDDDCNQTGQMLAALLDRPQATFVSKLELHGDKARAVREVDAGLETIEVDLPAVITVDLRLNEPRFVKMPDIMKAKKKPLEVSKLETFNIPAPPALQPLAHAAPGKRSAGTRVKDVQELVAALRQRGLLS